MAEKNVKSWHFIVVVFIFLIWGGLRIYDLRLDQGQVALGSKIYQVRIARTRTAQYRGWSRYRDMGRFRGMLFSFPNSGQHTMVMRDMRFPLDMIWLQDGVVVDMAPNVSPEPGRSESELTPYLSRLSSNFVLEMAAGTISESGLKIGDKVGLPR